MLFVYLLFNGNHYKIGFSKNPDKRIRELQTGSSEKIILIETYKSKFAPQIEKALHNGYNALAVIGNEWFLLDENEVSNFKYNCEKIENNLIFLENYKNFL